MGVKSFDVKLCVIDVYARFTQFLLNEHTFVIYGPSATSFWLWEADEMRHGCHLLLAGLLPCHEIGWSSSQQGTSTDLDEPLGSYKADLPCHKLIILSNYPWTHNQCLIIYEWYLYVDQTLAVNDSTPSDSMSASTQRQWIHLEKSTKGRGESLYLSSSLYQRLHIVLSYSPNSICCKDPFQKCQQTEWSSLTFPFRGFVRIPNSTFTAPAKFFLSPFMPLQALYPCFFPESGVTWYLTMEAEWERGRATCGPVQEITDGNLSRAFERINRKKPCTHFSCQSLVKRPLWPDESANFTPCDCQWNWWMCDMHKK